MSVHAPAGKFDNLSDLEVPISGLYLLAAPSTPEAVRDEVLDLAANGEHPGAELAAVFIGNCGIAANSASSLERSPTTTPLPAEKHEAIIALSDSGLSSRDVAAEVGVGQRMVDRVSTRRERHDLRIFRLRKEIGNRSIRGGRRA